MRRGLATTCVGCARRLAGWSRVRGCPRVVCGVLTGPAQTFFCGGRLVAGPEWPSLFGTSALIVAPCVVFLARVVPELARLYSPALLAVALWLPLFSLGALFVTGCSDPGIIPRIPPPEAGEFPGGRPRTKEVEVRGVKVSLKWNESTNFYQPPRAHHCSVNNDCVAKFDHHCPWVGTCVGRVRAVLPPLRRHPLRNPCRQEGGPQPKRGASEREACMSPFCWARRGL